jgi:hypothetical protein
MKWIYYGLLSSFLIAGISCCDHPDQFVAERGEDYFPLETGRILEYRVDSIVFDDAGATNRLDTFTAYVRERVLDPFVDLSGETGYLIQREYRSHPDLPWQVTDLWTAAADQNDVTRVEENQRIVKMEFALYPGKRWNPTRYINTLIEIPVGTETINMFSYWQGEVLSIHQPEQIGHFAFDSVMTCLQADDDNELERRFVVEKYVKGLGLAFRMDTIVDSRCERLGDFGPCLGMNWMEKGEKGYIMKMELINHN